MLMRTFSALILFLMLAAQQAPSQEALSVLPEKIYDVAPHDMMMRYWARKVDEFAAHWREDFEAFASAISGNRVTDDLFEIELSESPRLIIGWCKGAEEFLSVELPSAY